MVYELLEMQVTKALTEVKDKDKLINLTLITKDVINKIFPPEMIPKKVMGFPIANDPTAFEVVFEWNISFYLASDPTRIYNQLILRFILGQENDNLSAAVATTLANKFLNENKVKNLYDLDYARDPNGKYLFLTSTKEEMLKRWELFKLLYDDLIRQFEAPGDYKIEKGSLSTNWGK
jgi:hypothetical protein